jgi:hypothetical protein
VETRDRDPKREILEGEKATRGTGCGTPGNTGPRNRTFRVHQSLELRRAGCWMMSPDGFRRSYGKRQEGQRASRGVAAIGRGNPLKAEAHGRYRHETRPEGRRWSKASRG